MTRRSRQLSDTQLDPDDRGTNRQSNRRWSHKFNMVGVKFVVGSGSMIVSDRHREHLMERHHPVDPRAAAELDLYPVGRRLILGITVHAFFGEWFAQRADEIGELYERPQRFIEAPAIKQLPHPFPFTARSRVRADRRAIDEIIDAEILERRSRPTGDPFDILEAIVLDGSLSDAEIRDQVRTLIGARYARSRHPRPVSSIRSAWCMSRCACIQPG